MVLQAVFTLDLVAMMAGGRFQGAANTLVEAMEANTLAKAPAWSGRSTTESPCAGKATTAVHTAPPSKKAKRDEQPAPMVATGKATSGICFGGIPRIKMPPLDVFQRDYMATATPVILSGVS